MGEIKGKYVAGRDINVWKRLKNVGHQLSFWVGIGLTLLVLIASLFLPCPTASQFQLFRIAISIGLASFAGSLPGFFRLAYSGVIKIGTGLAVFLICYFTNPATIVINDDCHSQKILRGRVIYAGSPLAEVRVRAAMLNESDITNELGEFDIPYKDLHLPVNISFHFRSIDTLLQLNALPQGALLVTIRDTIPMLSDASIQQMIRNYLDNFQKEIVAQHQREMYRQQGRVSDLKEISDDYGHYEKIKDKYRNPVIFTNGFNTLTTQKSIRANGIRIDPMVPYYAYGLKEFQAFLYRDSLWHKQKQTSIYMDFAFLNNYPVQFEIREVQRKNRLEYRTKAEITNNIRYVHTFIEHTKSNNWTKYQRSIYKGMRPREEFIIRYIDGRWQLFDTKS